MHMHIQSITPLRKAPRYSRGKLVSAPNPLNSTHQAVELPSFRKIWKTLT